MTEYAATWAVAFVWTNAVELPIYVAMLQRAYGTQRAVLLLGFVMNVITHPALWFLLPDQTHYASYSEYLWVSEGIVFSTEMAIAAAVTWRVSRAHVGWAALSAVVANAASTSVGYLAAPLIFG